MEVTLPDLTAYFLRLGALGFGGPVALSEAMRRDLVEAKGWITEREYDTGLAIAAACPGPLAYQLGVYCGFLRQGVAGGLAVAVAFGLAPFLIVVACAFAYTRFAADWMQGLFYGASPVVLALILKACASLARKTLKQSAAAWAFALAACVVTMLLQRELTALFVLSGSVGAFVFAPKASGPTVPRPPAWPGIRLAMVLPFLGMPAASGTSAKLFVFFFKSGCLVFGSGLVIVPFLKTYVVDEYRWLSDQQFLDSVAIGMISPGPVVITATFVGYLVGGFNGALAATVGIFSPAVLFTVAATPLLLRHAANVRLLGFVRGVTVAVVGVLAGTTTLVGAAVVGDLYTAMLTVCSLCVIIRWPKLPDPVLIAAGAAAGWLAPSF